jgi:hypothetical protein
MTHSLEKHGYFPYRSGIQGTNHILPYSSHYTQVLESLKQTFDPNNIIAPNRYGINVAAET